MFNPDRKKVFLIVMGLLFFFFNAAAVLAQEKEGGDEIEEFTKFINRKRINAAYIIVGRDMFNFGRLNSYLTEGGFPGVPENYFTVGFGGHLIFDKLVLGLELQSTLRRSRSSTKEFITAVSAKYGLVNAGYLLYSKKGLMMYPLMGLGVGRLALKVSENNIHSFQDITVNQASSESITRSLLLNIGFAVDYFYKFNKKKKGKNNLVLGLRAGCLISASKWDWRVNGVRVGDGPTAGLTGPYIQLTIGMGGWIEKLITQAI
ncbi:MAG: hypothetical protein NT166_10635 [Candidatus Aminicenantes bacterium]|nr:hypothetical protein [Candidatus Aminicenantes bacterium]